MKIQENMKWYRVIKRGQKDELTKNCLKCHRPVPIWYDGECGYCKVKEETTCSKS